MNKIQVAAKNISCLLDGAEFHQYANTPTTGFEEIYLSTWVGYDWNKSDPKYSKLLYSTLRAPLHIGDEQKVAEHKIRMVAKYIDILLARHIWNENEVRYTVVRDALSNVIDLVRGKLLDEIANALHDVLDESGEDFQNNGFGGYTRHSWKIRYMPARMTWHIETEAHLDNAPDITDLLDGQQYDIEHVWSDGYELHESEFDNEDNFHRHRNLLGGLLLLPPGVNRSLKDAPYEDKLSAYRGQNQLASSLHEDTYENAPKLRDFNERLAGETGQRLKAHQEFKKADLDERQALYLALAQQIWNPGKLLEL